MAQKKVTVTLTDAEYSSIAPLVQYFPQHTPEEQKVAISKVKMYLIALATVRNVTIADWTMEPLELLEMRTKILFTGKKAKSTYQFDLLAGTPEPEINLADDDS